MPVETEITPSTYSPIHAPRGNQITCKGWQQEAAMRMLMNNLDEEVAERPQRSGRLWRHGAGGAQLGGVSRHRGVAEES